MTEADQIGLKAMEKVGELEAALDAERAETAKQTEKAAAYGAMAADANAILGGIERNERLRQAAERVVRELDAERAKVAGLVGFLESARRNLISGDYERLIDQIEATLRAVKEGMVKE